MFRIPGHVFKRMPPHDGEQGQQPDSIERTPGSPQMLHDVLKANGPVQRAHEPRGDLVPAQPRQEPRSGSPRRGGSRGP